MILSAWHIWLIVAILLFILEIFSADFFFAAIAAGCVAGGIAAGMGASINWQVGIFIASTAIILPVIRPAFKRYIYRKSDPRKTNVDAMIGRVATVLETVGSEHEPGRVKLGGEEWRAISETEEILEVGERVKVAAVSGATVTIVKHT